MLHVTMFAKDFVPSLTKPIKSGFRCRDYLTVEEWREFESIYISHSLMIRIYLTCIYHHADSVDWTVVNGLYLIDAKDSKQSSSLIFSTISTPKIK